MKNLFPGFYSQNVSVAQDYKDETTFIFDTNVLLNLYRYPDKPRELLLQILKEISTKIWLPYQIAMEYHYNVMEEIISQNKAYDSLIASLNDKYEKMQDDFQKYAQRHSNLQMDDDLLGKVKESLDALIVDLEEQKSKHPDLYNLQEEISVIVKNVGLPYMKEEMEELYEEGDRRYKLKIPPGFKDVKKGDDSRTHRGITYQNKFGDFLLWKQILDHFRKEENHKKIVIFITDDTKSDWWKNYSGIRKPHPELIQEFTQECQESSLLIFTTKQFLRHASELIDLNQNGLEVEEAIKGIDEYRKKKDISDLSENESSLYKEDLYENYPFLEGLNSREKGIFNHFINIAKTESDVENALKWAETIIIGKQNKFIQKRLDNDIHESKLANWDMNNTVISPSGFIPKNKELHYIDQSSLFNEASLLDRSNIEDEYSLLHRKINDIKNDILNESEFLEVEDREEMYNSINDYDSIKDMEFKFKKLKQLYLLVRRKRMITQGR